MPKSIYCVQYHQLFSTLKTCEKESYQLAIDRMCDNMNSMYPIQLYVISEIYYFMKHMVAIKQHYLSNLALKYLEPS